MLRLAVPSDDGALYEPSLAFLASCGMGISRPNPRSYTAHISSMPDVVVHFQRGSDIAFKVEEGSADVGLVGYDRFEETQREGGDTGIVIKSLGFGQAQLVLAVPDSWVDVTSLADLADLSLDFREQGMDLRVATKYPRLVERFLLKGGVAYFSLVPSSGTLEAAPAMGYADIISDITSSGTTLRENRLKTIHGGTVMVSEACLISNRALLTADEEKLKGATALTERIEARLKALEYYSVTANMQGEDAGEVARYVREHADISGLRGPTISRVYANGDERWFAVTVIIERDRMLPALERFREIGGTSVTVSQPDYVFHSRSDAVERLTKGV